VIRPKIVFLRSRWSQRSKVKKNCEPFVCGALALAHATRPLRAAARAQGRALRCRGRGCVREPRNAPAAPAACSRLHAGHGGVPARLRALTQQARGCSRNYHEPAQHAYCSAATLDTCGGTGTTRSVSAAERTSAAAVA